MTITDKCPFCDGTGYVKQDSMGVSGFTLFKCNYCGGTGNNKYPAPKQKKRCPFYEEEIFGGVVSQVFCIHPDIGVRGEYKCPYGEEYDCDIPIHLRNIRKAV